jgi:hypothetical protein
MLTKTRPIGSDRCCSQAVTRDQPEGVQNYGSLGKRGIPGPESEFLKLSAPKNSFRAKIDGLPSGLLSELTRILHGFCYPLSWSQLI